MYHTDGSTWNLLDDSVGLSLIGWKYTYQLSQSDITSS